ERDRSALLAEVSAVLAGSLDVEDTVRRAARLAVPALADYCVVDLLVPVGLLVLTQNWVGARGGNESKLRP
ncbi:MAG: hypothetical protein F6K28_57150, partial [Microcoleus sp. SIO2G3]|nr:hypothetical protein [Microcoleus sp. SIO2G3]